MGEMLFRTVKHKDSNSYLQSLKVLLLQGVKLIWECMSPHLLSSLLSQALLAADGDNSMPDGPAVWTEMATRTVLHYCIFVFGTTFRSVFVLKQWAMMVSWLEKHGQQWTDWDLKLFFLLQIFNKKFYFSPKDTWKIPPRYPPLPPTFKEEVKNPKSLVNVQVSGRTWFIHFSQSTHYIKCLCVWKEVSYREWMDLWMKSKEKTAAVWSFLDMDIYR